MFDFKSIKPARRQIILTYLEIKDDTRCDAIRYIANALGYKIDANNSNSFIRKVLRDFSLHGDNHDMSDKAM
jgi:hypothetical protein